MAVEDSNVNKGGFPKSASMSLLYLLCVYPLVTWHSYTLEHLRIPTCARGSRIPNLQNRSEVGHLRMRNLFERVRESTPTGDHWYTPPQPSLVFKPSLNRHWFIPSSSWSSIQAYFVFFQPCRIHQLQTLIYIVAVLRLLEFCFVRSVYNMLYPKEDIDTNTLFYARCNCSYKQLAQKKYIYFNKTSKM